ncbi:MAG: 23S rRNA (guanosine(2251)-2'-O)-methyltransferase RlmB [Burkholderiaceae bacterium]
MARPRALFGFHAVAARLRHDGASVRELYVDAARRDARMKSLIARAEEGGIKAIAVDAHRLDGLCGHAPHQGVVALVDEIRLAASLDDLLDALAPGQVPLLLILDGVTDPHNLGACLRVADGAGVHAVVAPKDRAAGLNATAAKVASGAAETMPYITVTNLARTLRELKERDVRVVGTSDDAPSTLYESDMIRPLAIVLGAEGEGMRRLTRETCDTLVSIPMAGAVESLNVGVSAALCLYEAVRQRRAAR